MKAFSYIRYFAYIGWNWNLRLAFFTLFHEIRGEQRYHLNTTGTNNLYKLQLKGKYREEAEIYQGASYYLVEKLFDHLTQLRVNDSIVDLGCGKGRVMIVAANYRFSRVTGVEFAKELCEQAAENITKFESVFPSTSFQVLHENAADYQIPDDATVIFLFNPFGERVMQRVIANITRSFRRRRRPVYVAYVNPQLKELFLTQGFREVFYIRKMLFVEASLLLIE